MRPTPFSNRLISFVFGVALLFGGATFSFADEIQLDPGQWTRFGDYWVSQYIDAPIPFYSISLRSESDIDQVEAELLGRWSPIDFGDDPDRRSALLFTSPTESVRFRIPVASGHPISLSADLMRVEPPTGAVNLGDGLLSGPTPEGYTYLSRSDWGADETIRYWNPDSSDSSNPESESESKGADACGDFATRYAQETETTKTVTLSPKGDILLWPLTYAKQVRKIIIHHTDSDLRDLNGDLRTDGQDYKAMVRAIYRFHAITRGWGDIGYNYLIDPLGNVYEGRYGGDRVIGAHAQCYNNGTLGISILGNYQTNIPSPPAVDSLISLVAQKSKAFGIDPTGHSTFRGKDLANVIGHRDVRPTSCPGDAFHSLLSKVRDRAGFILRSGSFSETSAAVQVMDYNASAQSQVPDMTLSPNERRTLKIRFRNTGSKPWDSNTWLYVSSNTNENVRVVPLIKGKNYVAADLEEGNVSPGDIGTFEFDLESGYFATHKTFELMPVANGRYRISKAAMSFDVDVENPRFDYEVVSQSLPHGPVFQGQKLSGTLVLRNKGNVTWSNYGSRSIRLGTQGPQDRRSRLSPHSPTRLATLTQSTVKPGETGTFVFNLEVPVRYEGGIVERFAPVIENVKWLVDKNLSFEVTVKKPVHLSRIVDKTSISKMAPGEMSKFSITLENRGDLPWDSDTMAVALLAKGVKIFKNEILPSGVVNRNNQSTFSFWVQAPYKEAQGSVYFNSKFRKVPIRGGTARFLIDVPAPVLRAQKISQSTSEIKVRPGELKELEVRFKNTGNAVWRNKGSNAVRLGTSQPQDRPSALYFNGSWSDKARAGTLVEKEVLPGQIGTFLFRIKPSKAGNYKENFQLVMEEIGWISGATVQWNILVSGERVSGNVDFNQDARDNKANAAMIAKARASAQQPVASSTPSYSTSLSTTTQRPFRVRISYGADLAGLTANKPFKVLGDGNAVLLDLPAGTTVSLRRVDETVFVQSGPEVKSAKSIRLVPSADGIVEITSLERRPEWNTALNDNRFRGILEVRPVSGATAYINELPLEDYLKGLSEVSNTTPFEKQKAIAILARSYAKYYMQDGQRKFPNMPYDGSDDPNVFQRYLGYGYELRSPNFTSAVKSTEGMVITYNGKLVKTPYFSQSDGRTRSAQEVWGWTNTPYLQSVDDPYCKGLEMKGHGVGMSGCGADGMAKAGKTYEEIIKYYYEGVEIETY